MEVFRDGLDAVKLLLKSFVQYSEFNFLVYAVHELVMFADLLLKESFEFFQFLSVGLCVVCNTCELFAFSGNLSVQCD
jgi:formate hydrogenlyase subunit 6/NADH:ubiquinone oxidoreductase subunit I